RNKDGSKPEGVLKKKEKKTLPRHGHANEAVIKLGMRDRWRGITSNPALKKILRQHNAESIDARDKKNGSGEFHKTPFALFTKAPRKRLYLEQPQIEHLLRNCHPTILVCVPCAETNCHSSPSFA